MTTESITWDLIARDRASATVGRVGGSVETLTRRVVHLAGAFGGAFALQQAGAFALKMADDFETSRARLENITHNIGSSFQSISGQVDAVDKRMEALGFTNAETEGSLASLESATTSVPKALRDVALAADIARGRNISLETATSILMRAETGHVANLGRLGIATKDAAGHTLTLSQMLDRLQQRYGGAAAHQESTAIGRQRQISASIKDSAAAIGVALLPAAADLAKTLADDVLPPIEHLTKFFDDNRKTIEPLVGDVLKLVIAYKALKIAQGAAAVTGIGRVATAAGAGGSARVAGGVLAGITRENPLPVWVINRGGMGGVVPVGGATAAAGEAAAATEGAVIGTAMAKGLTSSGFLGGLTTAATSLRTLGLAGLGLANFFSNPRSLGFPMGFNNDLNVGQPKGAHSKNVGQVFDDQGKVIPGAHNLLLLPGAKPDPAVVARIKAQAMAEKNFATQTSIATERVKSQAKALRDAQTRTLAIAGAQDQLRSAIANLALTASSNGRALRGNSDAALANRDALRGAVQQAESYVKTLRDQGVGHRKVAAAAEAMSRAIETNATKVYGDKGAIDVLLKSLHFLPGQIARGLAGIGSIGEQIGAQLDYSIAAGIGAYANVAVGQAGVVAAQIGKAARFGAQEPGGGQSSGNLVTPVSPTAPQVKAAASYGAKIGKAISDGYSPVIDKSLQDAQKKAFEKAQARMQADLGNIKSFLSSQKQTIFSAFSSLDTSPRTDSLGASGPAKSILGQLNADKRLADQFTRLFLRVDDAGATPRVLDMFEQLGPASIPTMRLWLSHPRKLRQANRDLRRVGADAARVGERATEDRYGPVLHHDLATLPRKIARELSTELRHLNITIDVSGHAKRRARAVRAS